MWFWIGNYQARGIPQLCLFRPRYPDGCGLTFASSWPRSSWRLREIWAWTALRTQLQSARRNQSTDLTDRQCLIQNLQSVKGQKHSLSIFQVRQPQRERKKRLACFIKITTWLPLTTAVRSKNSLFRLIH